MADDDGVEGPPVVDGQLANLTIRDDSNKLVEVGSPSDSKQALSLQIQGLPLDTRLRLFVSRTEYPMSLEIRAADFKFLNVVEIGDPEGAILDVQLEFERCITIGLTQTHEDHVVDDIRRQMLL